MSYDYASDPRYQTPDPTGDALKARIASLRVKVDGLTISSEDADLVEEYIAAVHTAHTPTTEAGVSLEEVAVALTECADELEVEVRARWGDDSRLADKLTRDLDTVVKARAILARIKESK